MSVLEVVQRVRAERKERLRATAIGADLIPRAHPNDPRYVGVDLAARGADLVALEIGMSRLVRAPEELGRWANDIIYAYSEVPNFSEADQLTAYEAWRRALVDEPD